MKQSKPQQQSIVQQELALDSYLSTLLDAIPDTDSTLLESEKTTEPPHKPVKQVLPSVVVTQTQVQRRQELVAFENATKLHPLSVMPDWTQHEFQALFFKVEHLILATPLVELSRTIKIEQKPGKIPGQPSWFLGLLDDQDSRIGVLDTGQLIFGKSRGNLRNLESNPFKSILITHDKRWGLACDEILSIGKLKPEKVRWRTNRQKKPWLIGTVIEELTTIIDIQELVPHRRRPN